MEKVPMLAEGYEKLTADLKALRAERPLIVDAIEEARAHGDGHCFFLRKKPFFKEKEEV